MQYIKDHIVQQEVYSFAVELMIQIKELNYLT